MIEERRFPMNARQVFVVASLFLASLSAVYAEIPELKRDMNLSAVVAYYPPNLSGYGTDGFAPVDFDTIPGGAGERDLGTGWGGAEGKVSLSHTVTIPAMRGDGMLFSGNSVACKLTGELSPVSMNAVFQISATPIAFFKLTAGAGIGTGFTLGFTGLAVNPASSEEDLIEEPFGGAVYRYWLSGTFQFDLAALVPGEWNHLVFQVIPKIEYKAYTGADSGEAWLWEADRGENFNGTRYYGTYLVGYQMPLAVNLVGFLLETEEWIGDVRSMSPMSSGWGSDFVTMNFGPLVNITLNEESSLSILVQFKTGRDYTDETTQKRSFQERDFEDGYLYFNRIAVSYSLNL